jgi:hypothetical protein
VYLENAAWAAVAEVQRVVGDGFVARVELLDRGQATHGRTLRVRRAMGWSVHANGGFTSYQRLSGRSSSATSAGREIARRGSRLKRTATQAQVHSDVPS